MRSRRISFVSTSAFNACARMVSSSEENFNKDARILTSESSASTLPEAKIYAHNILQIIRPNTFIMTIPTEPVHHNQRLSAYAT